MKFKNFSIYLEKLESTSSRNDLTVILADLLKELDLNDVKPVMYLLQGRVAPKYIDLEFNISQKLLLRSLSENFDPSKLGLVEKLFKEKGDVGSVVYEIVSEVEKNKWKGFSDQKLDLMGNDIVQREVKDKGLEINEVYTLLLSIVNSSGKGSQEAKMNGFAELISGMDANSSKYISRMIIGDLRLGLSEKTVLDSFSWLVKGDKSIRKIIDRAFGVRADIGELALLIKSSKDPESDLANIKLIPGTPIASKLVEREKDPESVWERMPNAFVQPKLDGLRGQLHYKKKEERIKKKEKISETEIPENDAFIFSRNMENMTDQFPELTESLRNLGVDSIVLDSEIIGFDAENNKYFSYQETMQRKRKYDVDEFANSFPVRSMCFDILYLNGEDLTTRPIEERIALLKKVLFGSEKADTQVDKPVTDNLYMLETLQMNSVEELDSYFQDKVLNGLEGIIIKEKESIYEPGTRNFKWIKLKANTRSDLVDTIDVTVIGYYTGRGQRAKFGIGALLTASYDPETDTYYSIGKVGSGMTEEMLEIIKKDLTPLEVDEKPENVVVEKLLHPDVWIKPKIVIEIDADEITRSPAHSAAKNIKANVKKDDSTRGLSVRFPRIKVWKRDKDYPNTVEEIVRMYELRKGK